MTMGQIASSGPSDLAQFRVQRHFADHRAFAPGNAIEYAPATAPERRAFDRLLASGVIREAHPAHYWFDLDRMGRQVPKRNMKAYIALGLGAVVAALTWMLANS